VISLIVFISGPMTGIPALNRPLFDHVEKLLKDRNHIVLNPAVHPDGMEHWQYMELCYPAVRIADMIIQLPGWENSKGAVLEYELAKRLNKKIESAIILLEDNK